jgi:hypothetical protein
MRRSSSITTATIRRTWINPPIVYEETNPSSHKMTKTTTRVSSMGVAPFMDTAVLLDGVFYPVEQNGTIRQPLNTRRVIPDTTSGAS